MIIPPGLNRILLPCVIPTPAQCFSVSYKGLQLEELVSFQNCLPKALDKAIDKRKIDFITGRLCVAQALSALDPKRVWPPVTMGLDRLPLWPEGIVGSITHTEGFTSACVALATDFDSVGIDAEKIMPLAQAEKIRKAISFESEIKLMQSDGFELAAALSLIFSAKESLFKCLYPLVQINFGFLDAELSSLDTGKEIFSIQLLRELSGKFGKGTTISGNFTMSESLVLTGVYLKN